MNQKKTDEPLPQISVMPCFYHFDTNRRIYENNGEKRNSHFYEYHFVKIEVIKETDKEYICQFDRVINKRSMLYKIDSSTRKKVFTEQEKEDEIYLNSKVNEIINTIRKSDANTLRKIEQILSAK